FRSLVSLARRLCPCLIWPTARPSKSRAPPLGPMSLKISAASIRVVVQLGATSATEVSELPQQWEGSGDLVGNVEGPWPFGRPLWLGVTLMKCVIHRQD